ncbi:MAG TPA: alpha/beta fold hydrolase [Lacibacter sp.]|nr:alpha/beta fold hydrolase [Lacibacter sp.]HMO88932.1 alpha/beta fold hydrolase [Lacibacter sp.]
MHGTVSTPSGEFHYQRNGTGEPVVLLHGFGEDRRIWERQVEALQQYYTVYTPDFRGSGKSPLPDTGTISMESLADDVQLLLEQEGVEQCVLLGHSMGGYVALAFAKRYPQYLRGLGLIHSTAYADSPEKQEARLKNIAFINEHGTDAFLRATLPNLFGERFKAQKGEVVEELIRRGAGFTPAALTAYTDAMRLRPDRRAVLQELQVPVLLFIGAEDKAVLPSDALEQAALPTRCMAEYLPGIAHMGMWEATDALNETLKKFLVWVEVEETDYKRLQTITNG